MCGTLACLVGRCLQDLSGRLAGVAGGRSRRHAVAINCDRVRAKPRFFLEGGDEVRFVLATKNSLARPILPADRHRHHHARNPNPTPVELFPPFYTVVA